MDREEFECEMINTLHDVFVKYREKGVIVDDIISVIIKYAAVTAFSVTDTEQDAIELIREGAIQARNVKRHYDKVNYDG